MDDKYANRIRCSRCNKYLYPVNLSNKDRNTWCSCEKIGVSEGWSGYAQKSEKKFWKQRR